MDVIKLSFGDLALASLLILILAALSYRNALGVGRDVLVAGLRTAVQLTLVGLVLKVLFANAQWWWVTIMALCMWLIAAREVWARQKYPLRSFWGIGVGASAMFISSFSLTVLALVVMIQPQPWYMPQYSIPILGMLLGNTMTAVALGLDRLNSGAVQQKDVIEARLALGQRWREAICLLRADSVRVALVPAINAMAAAGVVSLPGMMTGQILSGTAPVEAVKYQILIMFLITGAAGIGAVTAVAVAARRLFDDRERLCLNRIKGQR
jgi:putative ABC transport system permease protein